MPVPRVVWFVLKGRLLSVAGFLLRDSVGRAAAVLVTLGNVIIILGFVTALIAAVAWLVQGVVNR